MTNKTQEVLKYLQTTKNITSLDAIKLFGATRLSAIIFNLRKKGHVIITRTECETDRYGNECRYARYIYIGVDMKQKQIDKVLGKHIMYDYFKYVKSIFRGNK